MGKGRKEVGNEMFREIMREGERRKEDTRKKERGTRSKR